MSQCLRCPETRAGPPDDADGSGGDDDGYSNRNNNFNTGGPRPNPIRGVFSPLSPCLLRYWWSDVRTRSVQLAPNVEIERGGGGGGGGGGGAVNCLALECVESRYLLSGGHDAGVVLTDLDTSRACGGDSGEAAAATGARVFAPNQTARIKPLKRSRRSNRRRRSGEVGGGVLEVRQFDHGHANGVTDLQWYPIDTGIFISASFDKTVKVWDTNEFKPVEEFVLEGKVFSASLSPVAVQHSLIATGSDSPQVRLCDINSGGFSHILVGHTEAVTTTAWSPANEFLLATGSADAAVRLWDIRRSGAAACLMCLDRNDQMMGNFGGGGGGGGGRGAKRPRAVAGPHWSTAQSNAQAHAGRVAAMGFTPDGMHLLTAGADARLYLWDALKGQRVITNYEKTANRFTSRGASPRLTVCQTGRTRDALVFYPNGKRGDVLVFPVHTSDGRALRKLTGHFGAVLCTDFCPEAQQVVTGGADGLLLVWSPPVKRVALPTSQAAASRAVAQAGASVVGERDDVDNWSDDDDDDDGGGGGGGGGGYVPPILQPR